MGHNLHTTTSNKTVKETKMSKQYKARIKNALAEGEEMLKAVTDLMEGKTPESVVGERLIAFINRIERLEEEKKALGEDIREIYSEAKGVGFDAKTIRKLVKLRQMDTEKRREEQELLELYAAAIELDLGGNND